jgi:hypothetical protein
MTSDTRIVGEPAPDGETGGASPPDDLRPPDDVYEQAFGSPDVSTSPDGPASRFVVELLLERTAREERDVGRLVRIDELLERFPGNDRIILRILGVNGRDTTALELAERVSCCADLLEEMAKELGEDGVRVRLNQHAPSHQGTSPPPGAPPRAPSRPAPTVSGGGGEWPAPPAASAPVSPVGVALAGG